jgi:translation initiation factor 2B subunit (eIF-2B alpha/beta/delta family)
MRESPGMPEPLGEPSSVFEGAKPSRRLRDIVFSDGECGRLFDQAERLCQGLFDLKEGRVMIPFFTDHGPLHCHRVEDILNRIVFLAEFNLDDPRMFSPTPEEAMYLLAAAWVHDIGMIYGIFPGETLDKQIRWEQYREDHERRSAKFIRTEWKIECDWNDVERMWLAELCMYHRHRHSLESLVSTVPGRSGATIRLRQLAALLRLADACHVDKIRAPIDMKNLFRSFGMPVRATEHWGLASLIHDVLFDHDTRTIRVHCYLPRPREYGTATVDFHPVVKRIAQAIERELTTVIPYLSAYANTDFKSVVPETATLISIDDVDEFLRRIWPCVLALTTSASEGACMGAAVVESYLRDLAEVPRKELLEVLVEMKRLHPYNFLLRRLALDIEATLQRDIPADVSGRHLELAAMRQYLNRFLDERRAARSRVAEAVSAHIDPDDTLIIYGYSSMLLHLLTEVLKGHCGRVLMVRCRQSGQDLAVEEEHERMTNALRRVHLSFREVEMASLCQILGHFRKGGTKAKILLGASGILADNDVLAPMGSAMIASAARDCRIPVLVLAEREKKLPKGAMDVEMERLLADQAAALISTSREDATSAAGDRGSEAITPIDRLTPDMYDLLVGVEEDITAEPEPVARILRHSPGSQ